MKLAKLGFTGAVGFAAILSSNFAFANQPIVSGIVAPRPPVVVGLPAPHPRPPVLGLPAPRPPRPPVVVGLPVPPRPPVLGIPLPPRPHVFGLPAPRFGYEIDCVALPGSLGSIRRLDLHLTKTSVNTFSAHGDVRYFNGTRDRIRTFAVGKVNLIQSVALDLENVGSLRLNNHGPEVNFQGYVSIYHTIDNFGLSCLVSRD